MVGRVRLAGLFCVLMAAGCSRAPEPGIPNGPADATPGACDTSITAAHPLPGIKAEHLSVDHWLRDSDADTTLMDSRDIALHNQAIERVIDGERLGRTPLAESIPDDALLAQINERLSYVRAKVEAGDYVNADGKPIGQPTHQALSNLTALPPRAERWHRANALTPIRCVPVAESFFTAPVDTNFDRNLCSTAREGELMKVVATWPDGLRLVRTSYTLGWTTEEELGDVVPRPTDAGVEEHLPLTRRNLFTRAFERVGKAYGWGGRAGGLDCSRFLLDVFDGFGIRLPRHSASQARAGTFMLDVASAPTPEEKLLVIDAAAERGIVLLQFPGHIMLYLGRAADGRPMAIHAFAEFATACEHNPTQDQIHRIDRVTVTDLSIGQSSSRKDFLSRVTTVTVLGAPPGRALVANAVVRPPVPPTVPVDCKDSVESRIFRSPHRPVAGRPLRVVSVSERPLGTETMRVINPAGRTLEPALHRLDGPPHTVWTRIETPTPGEWTFVVGEGDQPRACKTITVAARAPKPVTREGPAPAWVSRWRWEQDTENLFSAFVEQLFLDPQQDDVTWSKMQELIADPARNLLYDHRSPGEDARLDLEPDCADLPYLLRAYFAWKLRLPFGFRDCSRGKQGRPPRCMDVLESNLYEVDAKDDVAAFSRFVRKLASTVHSASARTVPDDSNTDLYPIEINSRTMRPGTVFADPYGHLLVIARMKPQAIGTYGVLVGADAQPDGTVGRRRFWRGSFLFHPRTTAVGAGFKAWRPVRFVHRDGTVQDTDNATLARAKRLPRWSRSQYDGNTDDFYESVQALVNPRPLDPVRLQLSLVDALEESVARRLNSVDNGEAFMAERNHAPINMPRGGGIFLTTGPWEDFSTPSRDMRLLISMDAVIGFADRVRNRPGQFGIEEAAAEQGVAKVERALQEGLAARSFTYKRSDGSEWTLTLQTLVERMAAFELAYNPNDCPETRWGAPDGSDEAATCNRHAPADQTKSMHTYRPWFVRRERPAP